MERELFRGVKRRGLTMVEVMVALAVAGVALLTMAGVFISGLQLVSNSRDLVAATEVAREMSGRIRQLGFGAVPATTVTFDGRAGDAPISGFPPAPYPISRFNGQEYAIVVSIRPLAGNLRSVTTEVHWGHDRHLSVQTYLRP